MHPLIRGFILFSKGVFLGLRKNWKTFIGSAFATYGVIWTFIESFHYFLLGDKPSMPSPDRLITLGVISLLCGAVMARWQKRAVIKSNAFSTTITISYGDLFAQDGLIVIPVNEYFDSLPGDHVSPRSLHGQFINNVFGGASKRFDASVANALQGTSSAEVQRPSGNCHKYDIGTVAPIPVGSKEYLCVALSVTDASLKASADVPMLWKSLVSSLRTARIKSGGRKLVLPLMGGGLSGTGLDPNQLLNLALTAIFEESKKQLVCTQIVIVLHESVFDSIDLAAIKKIWRA